MSDLTGLGFWLGFWVFLGVIVAAVFRARLRRYQLRNEVVLKLLETGQSLDPETLDKLLALPGPGGSAAPQGPTDPRAGYRIGNSLVFMIGFATLFYAFTREAGLSYPLIALGAFAIVLAFLGWWVGDKQFRDGTLPTLKYKRDPRDAHLNGGIVFFWIGYGTMFFGINREAGLSYPIIALGLLLVLMCFNLWRLGNKEYREGRLTGIPLEREEA
jgi:hypothetical protein